LSDNGPGIPGRIEKRSVVSTSARYWRGRALEAAGPLLGQAFAVLRTQNQRPPRQKFAVTIHFF
jgi:hypothetical protein